MRGGYQIIDFQKKSLSSTNTNIEGIYNAINDNFNKALQLNSLNIGGTLKDDVYAFATKGSNKYTFDVYDGILTVTSADNVRWVSHDTIQTVISNIDDLQQETSDIKGMISDAYNAETAYTAGQYCIYNDTLYKCIADTTAGTLPTDTDHFSEVTIADEISALNDYEILRPTYITNDYCSSTDVARISIYRKGKIGVVKWNLRIGPMPTDTSNAPIAKFDTTLLANLFFTISGQNGGGEVISCSIDTDGTCKVSNTSGVSVNAFFRAAVPVIFA